MTRLSLAPHLTRGFPETLEHQIRTTHEGQAHWANTGPFGATCGECAFLGYFREWLDKFGNTTKATHTGGCAKFFELTKKHGPVVPANAAACRYFQRKEKEEKEKEQTP
jgi:hypothetical protein